MRIGKHTSLASQPVHIRGLYFGRTVYAYITVAQIIGIDDNDIGFLILLNILSVCQACKKDQKRSKKIKKVMNNILMWGHVLFRFMYDCRGCNAADKLRFF